MNKVHRSVWNDSRGCYVAASEITTGKSKNSRSVRAVTGAVIELVAAMTLTGFTAGTALAQTTVNYADGSADAGAYVTTTANLYTLHSLDTGSATQSGLLAGNGSITKTGNGTLILSGPNTYTGGTTVSGGILSISNDNNLGAASGGLALDGGTLALGGSITTNRAITLGAGGGLITGNATGGWFLGPITGAGALSLQGQGAPMTVYLSNANTYAGGTRLIGKASVYVLGTGALGSGPVALTNNGNALSFTGAGVSAGNLTLNNGLTNTDTGNAINFTTGTTAGTAHITNIATNSTQFAGTADAGNATLINNNGYTFFNDSSSANNAQITNSGVAPNNFGATYFNDSADAGAAHITNSSGGATHFVGSGSAPNATIVNGSGGVVTIHQASSGVSIGSLSGAGQVILGSRRLTLGNLNLNDTISGVLSDGIGTGGSLVKAGSGTLTLSGANTYTGATTVSSGTLLAGAVNTLSASSAHTVAAGATLDLAGYNQTVAALANAGTVSLKSAAAGSTLTVNGAYVGNGGTLALGTVLSATGPSDQLVISGAGASAAGNTNIAITNLGGLGAQTTGNGIAVVSVLNGATSTATAFALNGTHVDAGAYEYRLAKAADSSWYLSASAAPVTPVTPVTPVIPVAPVTPVAPLVPSMPVTPSVPAAMPTYRAEVAVHNALPNAVRQGDLAMLSTLQRRTGDESRPVAANDSGSGWGGASRRGWARVLSGSVDMQQSGVANIDSHSSLSGVQAGVDAYADTAWTAGLYAGALRNDGHVDGLVGGIQSRAGSFRNDSTYLGLYGTYTGASGFFTNLVLQYGRHKLSTSAPLTSSSANGESLNASVEAGQRYALGNGWAVEPQAQLIYGQTKLEAAAISGASIQQDAAKQWTGRLGLRLTTDVNTGFGRLQPYGRVNLWHGFSGTDTTRFVNAAANTGIDTGVGYTSTEVAAGLTLQLAPAFGVYGELGQMYKTGGSDAQVKSSVQGSVGLKLSF